MHTDPQMDLATTLLTEGKGLIPDELVALFEYASNGPSLYTIDTHVFEGHTPQRDRRTAQLQLYTKTQALMDLCYGESKRQREIQRIRIKIRQMEAKATRTEDPMEQELLALDLADLQEQILHTEDAVKLTKPLIKDAQREYDFYLQRVRELDRQGLGDPEAAEPAYFRAKALHEAKLDALANATGFSKPVVDQLLRIAPQSMDAMLPPAVGVFLEAAAVNEVPPGQATEALPEGDPTADAPLHVFLLQESEQHPHLVAAPHLARIFGQPVTVVPMEPAGSPDLTRRMALCCMQDQGLPEAIFVDGSLAVADSVWHALAERRQQGLLQACLPWAPTKWEAPSVWHTLGLDPGLLYVARDAVATWADLHDALLAGQAVQASQHVLVHRLHVPPEALVRIDYDTKHRWT